MPRVAGWILLGLALLAGGSVAAALWMTVLPGRSHGPDLPPLTSEETILSERVAGHLRVLAGEIGERNARRPEALSRARDYVTRNLENLGYPVHVQSFPVGGITVANLEAVVPGLDPDAGCLVVGAHYDSAPGTPGANDNASGVGVVLELARLFRKSEPVRELRFVFFVNEEPPFFATEDMGSLRHARELASRGIRVEAMISVETVGYYSDRPGSQKYPFPLGALYPDTGNFIAFVGNLSSRGFLRKAARAFRREARLPSEGGSLPGSLPGIGWSDQWAYWQVGVPAIMVTDTAPFRYPEYHEPGDLPREVDTERVARVTAGLAAMLGELSGTATP